ncbi:MAG: hypothetical protein K0S47_3125 [Herbinix sp.]|jgi:hypothetical protein|nr:hypothetical protein [Herbinix sp.]
MMSDEMRKWLEDSGGVIYAKGSGLALGAGFDGEENLCMIFLIDKKTNKALGGTPLAVFPADEDETYGYVIEAYKLATEIAEYYGELDLAETFKATELIERVTHGLM